MHPVPKISDVDLAFPARAGDVFPERIITKGAWGAVGSGPRGMSLVDAPADPDEDAPKRYAHNLEVFQGGFFQRRWAEFRAVPREGVDPRQAFRVLNFLTGCWGIPHERKEATWAFLADEWFAACWLEKDGPPSWAPVTDSP